MKIAKRYRFLIVLCFLLLPVLYVSRAAAPVPRQGNNGLRVATFNLLYRAQHPQALTQMLREWDLDMVIFLEYSGSNVSSRQMQQAGYRVDTELPLDGTHGIAVYSKKALQVKAMVIPSPVNGPCKMPFAAASIKHQGQMFNIIGVHIPPPIPACNNTTDTTIEAVAALIKQGKLKEDLAVLKAGLPTIVMGDFNAFPFNGSLSKLKTQGMTDAEQACGRWLCPTWSPQHYIPALIRIDYIFVPDTVTPLRSWVVNIPGSDHRGVIADLGLDSTPATP